MTKEQLIGVGVALDCERRRLIADIRSAAARAASAEPGDRLDVVRFEALSSLLEQWVFGRRTEPGSIVFAPGEVQPADPTFADEAPLPSWVGTADRQAIEPILAGEYGGVVVAMRLPLESGPRPPRTRTIGPPPAAAAWRAAERRGDKLVTLHGIAAVQKRFEEQLENAVLHPPAAFSPSGVSNKVISETLRSFVNRPTDSQRVAAPVEYRDGSRSLHPFPLRAIPLADAAPTTHDLTVSFSLLSIRHLDMDAQVDGAWLRNTQISQPRPQGQTDDLAFEISRDQLEVLTRAGTRSVHLTMYQTGLEPANVAFYRAVAHHLADHPGCLTVKPQYYVKQAKAAAVDERVALLDGVSPGEYDPGTIWAATGVSR